MSSQPIRLQEIWLLFIFSTKWVEAKQWDQSKNVIFQLALVHCMCEVGEVATSWKILNQQIMV